jgi:hypothetical protein
MPHEGRVWNAILMKDERRKDAELWDVATGQQIGPAMRHDAPVFGATLTRDERRILSWAATTRCGCGMPPGQAELSWRKPTW